MKSSFSLHVTAAILLTVVCLSGCAILPKPTETVYEATYFDTTNPEVTVFKEKVRNIAIQYAWSEFHNIDAQNLGAKWEGVLVYKKPVRKEISVSNGHSDTKIFIDDQLVFEGGNDNATFTKDFEPGEYKLRVEHENNWHTAAFKVIIEDVRPRISQQELIAHFNMEELPKNPEVFYVSLYESRAKDMSVKVPIPETNTPIVLLLFSYSSIDWHLSGKGVQNLSDIIIGSYEPAFRVFNTGNASIHILNSQDSYALALYKASEDCFCHGGSFHCESDKDLTDINEFLLEGLLKRPVTRFDVAYTKENIELIPFTEELAGLIADIRYKNNQIEASCTRTE